MGEINFFENLDWRGGVKRSKNINSDVSVSVSKDKAITSFVFRNEVYDLITQSGRIEFVKNGCVCMFREGKHGAGYKLSQPKTNTSKNKYMKATYEAGDEILEGDYDLKYEEKFKVYYIDLEEKK